MKYLIICIQEFENGKIVLPRIERVITAKDETTAREKAEKEYPKYNKIEIFEWQY